MFKKVAFLEGRLFPSRSEQFKKLSKKLFKKFFKSVFKKLFKSNLKSFLKALIGWKKTPLQKSHFFFWKCKRLWRMIKNKLSHFLQNALSVVAFCVEM